MLNINYGSQSVAVTKGSKIRVRTNGQFTVYAQSPDDAGELAASGIYGPRSFSDRFTCFIAETDFIAVECDDATMWGYEEISRNNAEILDHTPIEISAEQSAPLSLKDEMRRFISDEISRVAESQDEETFEESDDFDLDDDDLPESPYELTEMQEEFLMEPPEPPSETPHEAPDATPAPPAEPPHPQTPATSGAVPLTPETTNAKSASEAS